MNNSVSNSFNFTHIINNTCFFICKCFDNCINSFMMRWHINVLTIGEQEAETMGVSVGRTRLIALVAATLITAAVVSVSGMIGWVGLVIPHFCRKFTGSNFRWLLPASMLTGALFLLLVDDVSRNLFAVEIPIGILTAMIGAPFFLYLIFKGGRK